MKIKSYKLAGLLLVICSILFMIIILGNYTLPIQQTDKVLPVMENKCSYSIDVDNLQEVFTDADYVFLAKTNGLMRTDYKNLSKEKTKDGENLEDADPYSVYSVRIIKNVKGNLPENKNIEISKIGGLSYDKKYYSILEGDKLLEENNYYVICAYVQPDGTLLMSGKNSSIYYNYKEYSLDKVVKKYKEMCLNRVDNERGRIRYSVNLPEVLL